MMRSDDANAPPTDPRDLLGRVVSRGEVLRRRRHDARRISTAALVVFVAGIMSVLTMDLAGDSDLVTTSSPTSVTSVPMSGSSPTALLPATQGETLTSTAVPSRGRATQTSVASVTPPARPVGPRRIPTIAFDRAVGEANEIVVLRAGASRSVVLVPGGPFLNSISPSFSPSGTEVAVATTRNSLVNGLRSAFDIWIHPLDGGQPRQVTVTNDFDMNGVSYPAWSPDGSQIAYAGADPVGHVWLVGVDGSNPRELSTGSGGQVAGIRWSPDGRFLSYLSPASAGGCCPLRIFDLATGSDRAVPVDPPNGAATWTRDGRALLYSRGPAGASVVIRYDLATTTETVVPTQGSAHFPAPCGVDQIVVMRDADDSGPAPATVVAMGLDGSRPTTITAAALGSQPRTFSCAAR